MNRLNVVVALLSAFAAISFSQSFDTVMLGSEAQISEEDLSSVNEDEVDFLFRGLKVDDDGRMKEEVVKMEDCASAKELDTCVNKLETCTEEADDKEELKMENDELSEEVERLSMEIEGKNKEIESLKSAQKTLPIKNRYSHPWRNRYNSKIEQKHPDQEKEGWTDFEHACIKHHNVRYFRASGHNHCLSECEKENDFQCCSVDYNFNTKLCSFSVETNDSVSASFFTPCYRRGWSYAQRTTQGCVDRDAVRKSDTRNTKDSIVTSTSGARWTPLESGCIKDNNNRVFFAKSLTDCRNKCEKATEFNCCSVDYNYQTKVCDLSTDTMASPGSTYYSQCYKLGWSYTERIDDGCARDTVTEEAVVAETTEMD